MADSLLASKNTVRQKRTRRQGINKRVKKVSPKSRQERQITVLVGNPRSWDKKKLPQQKTSWDKEKLPQQNIAMSGWTSSGHQGYYPTSSYTPFDSYTATNQNLGRGGHNFQVRETLAHDPNLRNDIGRHSSAVSQNYGTMGQNINMGGLGSQGYSGLKMENSFQSSSVSNDRWRADRPGLLEKLNDLNKPVVVVDYGHVRSNPPPNPSKPWESASSRDRSQSDTHIRSPIVSQESISFINNIAITEDIMSSLKKTVHLVSGGAKSAAGASHNTTFPSFNPSMAKRTQIPISALLSGSLPDHHKHLDPYNNASDFSRQEQMRVTQKKTDRNKAFSNLKEWRQKINLPTDILMSEREELFPSDLDRGSGLVDISPTSMSGLQQHEESSPPRPMTSLDRRMYVTGEKQRWKPYVKPVTSSLSPISDVEDFGFDERRNKDFSFSKEIDRKDNFSHGPGYSENPGLRYTYDQSYTLETKFKQKGYGKSSSPHAERYRQSHSYRSRSRSRSPIGNPSKFSRRSRSPIRKSQRQKSADNSRRTLSPISSTHRTSREDYQSRHSPFMSPISQFSSGYEPHGQDSSSLQNLFDRPSQLSARMYSRSPSPRSRTLDLGKFSLDSDGAKSPIHRSFRPRGLSPTSRRTYSRSQSPMNRRLSRYPTLPSRSLSPIDRFSRSISPRNRRMHARSRSPRSLSPKNRRLTSRSISPRNRRLPARSRSPRSRRDMTRTRSPRSVRITSRSRSPRIRGSLSPKTDRRSPLWHQLPRNRRLSGSRSLSPRNDRRTSPWHLSPRNRGLSRSRSPRYRSRSPRNRRHQSSSQSSEYRRLSLRSLSPGNRRILSRTPSPRSRSSRSPGFRNERRDFDLVLTSRLGSPNPGQGDHRSKSGRQSPSGRNKGTSLHHDRIYFDKDSDKGSLYRDELGSTSPRQRHWSEEEGSSKRTVSISEERNEKNVDELLKQIRNTHDQDKVHVRVGRDSPEDLRHTITARKTAKAAATSELEESNEDLRLQILRIKERKISKRIEMLEKESIKTESELIEIEHYIEKSQSSFEDDLPQDYKFSSKSPEYSRSKRSSSPTFGSFDLRKEEISDPELSSEEWGRTRSGGKGKTTQHDHQREIDSRKKSESSRVGSEKTNRGRDSGGRNVLERVRRYPKGRHEY